MKPFSILVPTDFSEASLKAIDSAVELRGRHPDMKITLLYVCEQASGLDPLDVPVPLLMPTEAEALPKLQGLVGKFSWTMDVPIECVVRTGSPADEILAAAKEMDADFIVMSTHGHTGFWHLLMGSVAEEVIRKAPCPVMVVRNEQPAA